MTFFPQSLSPPLRPRHWVKEFRQTVTFIFSMRVFAVERPDDDLACPAQLRNLIPDADASSNTPHQHPLLPKLDIARDGERRGR
jgi:hypothetical protein